MSKILIVEDEESIAELEKDYLELSSFEVEIETDGEKGLKLGLTEDFDMIILDIMLPGVDGFEICKQIREKKDIPILMVSAKKEDIDKIRGLGLGADDYITKPFNIKIVIQRIKAILRRCEGDDTVEKVLQCGNLAVDFESHTVKKHGKLLTLTPTEFKLLHRFCLNPGQVLTRQILLEKLWDQDGNFVDEHTLTINISRLRAKIADEEYAYIKTIYGVGYKWIGESHE